MSTPQNSSPGLGRRPRSAPLGPPRGWPIGSYSDYLEAQRAVDYLSDNEFPVQDLTIVGVDLMQVEKVLTRLTWGRVLAAGAGNGAWFGLFVGLLLSFVDDSFGAIIFGVIGGIIFGTAAAAAAYAATGGKRDFASTMGLVAGRYDVICDPKSAERAREMLARLSLSGPQSQSAPPPYPQNPTS